MSSSAGSSRFAPLPNKVLQRTWQRRVDIDRGRIAESQASASAVQGCATPLNADPLGGGGVALRLREPGICLRTCARCGRQSAMDRLILLTKQREEPAQLREGLGVVVDAQSRSASVDPRSRQVARRTGGHVHHHLRADLRGARPACVQPAAGRNLSSRSTTTAWRPAPR